MRGGGHRWGGRGTVSMGRNASMGREDGVGSGAAISCNVGGGGRNPEATKG